jgi:hypothetical protein
MGKGVQYFVYLYKYFISGTHFGKYFAPKITPGAHGTKYLLHGTVHGRRDIKHRGDLKGRFDVFTRADKAGANKSETNLDGFVPTFGLLHTLSICR